MFSVVNRPVVENTNFVLRWPRLASLRFIEGGPVRLSGVRDTVDRGALRLEHLRTKRGDHLVGQLLRVCSEQRLRTDPYPWPLTTPCSGAAQRGTSLPRWPLEKGSSVAEEMGLGSDQANDPYGLALSTVSEYRMAASIPPRWT